MPLATKSSRMILKYKYLVFLLLFLLVSSLWLSAQDLSLKPAGTKMVSRNIEESEGVVTTYYRYQSTSSKAKIVSFYRRLLKNRGFKQIKARGSSGAFFFFSNQAQGLLVILAVFESTQQPITTYSLTNHHFSLKPKD